MVRFLFFILFLSACDSPRNHRLQDLSGLQKAQNILTLTKLDLRLQSQWVEGPYGNVQKSSSLVIYVYNQKQELTDLPSGKDLEFFATMPSMGHPLDQPGEFIRVAKGIYINSSIRFNMPGDWQMEVSIVTSNNEIVEQAVWLEFF
jgi:hypothetical protein